MSDAEEPPTKVSKTEDDETPETLEGIATEDESMMDEGQEEWLSEGVLTDDDFNHSVDQDKNDSNFGNISQISQEENLPINDLIEQLDYSISTDHEEDREAGHGEQDSEEKTTEEKDDQDTVAKLDDLDGKAPDGKDPRVENKDVEQTIEETLITFEGVKTEAEEALESVLNRNHNEGQQPRGDEIKRENSDDDGNDTDDLLRMLGEDNNKAKKKVLKMSKNVEIKGEQSTDDDDDDGFVYQDAKLTKYSSLKKGQPSKAVPENMSDGDDETDASSDEAETMQKMFSLKQHKGNVASKSTAKSSAGSLKRQVTKHVVDVPGRSAAKTQQFTPKTYQNQKLFKSKQISSNANSQKKYDNKLDQPKKFEASSRKPDAITRESEPSTPMLKASISKAESSVQKPGQLSKFDALKADMAKLKDENDEIIDEEEFLEDDEDFELDEDEFAEESDVEDQSKGKQTIRKPESMDEEVPSDDESRSENGSLYDELPSSDSEDMDDWFKLDIRAERAADYLPFLGSKARDLLIEEKRRVASRLDTLRQSLTALTDSARLQADQIRSATMTLAELDDMLKAT